MKVLVTGATGFVGTALRRALRGAGFDVRAFVRPRSAHRIEASEGIAVVTGHVLDSHACLRATTGMDAVVHLVGIRREHPRTGTTYEALHTEATWAVVDAARRNDVRRFVYVSGLGARPDAPSVTSAHVPSCPSSTVAARACSRCRCATSSRRSSRR